MIFVDAGLVGGVRYVDVIRSTGDPVEYLIPLTEAYQRYGMHPLRTIAELA